jgi:putative redox protein
MGMIVTIDRMVHTHAVHQDLNREVGMEGCCAFGGEGKDLNPIDLVAMAMASCLQIVMANSGKSKGIDLTGTAYERKDYKIASITVKIHSPYAPSAEDREFLEKEAHRCPVYLAVKDGTKVSVAFEWGTCAKPAAKKTTSSCCCKG